MAPGADKDDLLYITNNYDVTVYYFRAENSLAS